ncbi:MAG: hypothetical protein IJT41_00355 [Clostridia bacterium]|nr:hypothetical protein [Clostridia bacterium]
MVCKLRQICERKAAGEMQWCFFDKHAERMLKSLSNTHLTLSITSRLKDGNYTKALRASFVSVLKEPSARHFEYLRTDLMWLCLGDYMMRTYFRDYTVRRMEEYTGMQVLYHYAPTESVERILSTGLKPSKRFVYLTDDPEFYKADFLPWKDRITGRQTCYTLLEVDANALTKCQPIYATHCRSEFVTDSIAPQYLTVCTEGHIAAGSA